MPTKVRLRALTADERSVIEKLTRSRTEEARLVERAQDCARLGRGRTTKPRRRTPAHQPPQGVPVAQTL